jgi:hypothetical protein
MSTEDTDSKASTAKAIYRFLGGAALGAFVVATPMMYGSSIDLSWIQVSLASALSIACGLLSSVWGGKFIDMVMKVLNNSGL